MKNQPISLAVSALDCIPKVSPDADHIVAIVKRSGKITGYQLSDGTIVSKEDGIILAKTGHIAGVGIAHRKGTEYLKSIPDGSENNNISNLPCI